MKVQEPGVAGFESLSERLRMHAAQRPKALALGDENRQLDWLALDVLVNRVAAALQRDGVAPGDAVATCAGSSVAQAVLFLGALRAGAVPALVAPSVTAAQFSAMVCDSGSAWVFADAQAAALLCALPENLTVVDLGGAGAGLSFEAWMAPERAQPQPVPISPEDPFNIIYSSGTTGTPKGIVQPHRMRFAHMQRAERYGMGKDSVVLLATPLYSNTTLVAFVPALGAGSFVHLMSRFDPAAYLRLAQELQATHTMLVPVQYRRLLEHPRFDEHDLSAFRMKLCTSAPFDAVLKEQVLARWPGDLLEVYGMTEGGGACMLDARAHPHKLHTVGRPAPGHEIRLIDEAGCELPVGTQAVGEVVGRSPAMMTGYHRRPENTREAEWFDAEGLRYIRTGDVGRFDEDGFLVLMDRRKDMVISGGFNIYPKDLEAVIRQHPDVQDAAVFGVPSARWGETPVACVVLPQGRSVDLLALRSWVNDRLGRTQRLAALMRVQELPRSAIGKVLKRELRELWMSSDISVE